MACYLTIDIGNTRTKATAWIVRADGEIVGVNLPIVEDFIDDKLIKQRFWDFAFQAAVVCSVTDRVKVDLSPLPTLFLNAQTPVPISIGYGTSTLGMDRLAAVVGAWNNVKKASLVIDAGTAVTYDYIDGDATFVGGNIAPGIRMRIEALHQHTSHLPLVEAETPKHLFGRNTSEALTNGAVEGVVAEIVYYINQLNADTEIYLTGGDSGWIYKALSEISPALASRIHHSRDLVAYGLLQILLYNLKQDNSCH